MKPQLSESPDRARRSAVRRWLTHQYLRWAGTGRPRATSRRALLALASVCALLLLAGCAGHPQPSGVYALVSVDGKKIPTTISHEGAKLEIRSGEFTFNPDGKCSSKMVFVPPNGTEATIERKATYTRNGAKLNMKWDRAGITTGTLRGESFTMNNEGMILAYQK